MIERTYVECVRETLAGEMRRDETVVILGEDIHDPFGGVFKATKGLQDEFGALRVRPTPISENGFVGVAVGAALTGLRPVVELMVMDFLALALDQLVNHAAKLRYMTAGQLHVPLTLRTVAGGTRGSGAQHSQHLEAWVAHVPGLMVAMPATGQDVGRVLRAAIRGADPVVVVENSNLYFRKYEVDPSDEEVARIGSARIARSGEDVTVVATSRMVSVSEIAAATLAQEGVSAEVIDLCWIRPWDRHAIVESVTRTGRLIVAHDAVAEFGIGAEIVATLACEGLPLRSAPIRLGARPSPVPYARTLEEHYTPDVNDVIEAVRRSLR